MRPIDADALIEFCAERWIPLNIDAVNMQPTIQPVATDTNVGDTISRQAAIDALDFKIVHMTVYCDGKNEGNPLAQYNKGLEDGKKAIEALPTVQPEPKEGHWIDKGWNGDWAWQIDGRGNCWRVIECSECGKSVLVESNYCPNCGAKMTISK